VIGELPRRLVIVAALALGLSWFTAPIQAQPSSERSRPASRPMVRIEVLDVGQGDSILIRSPEGKTALVDAGPTRDGALNALKSKGVTAIDMVVVSHHHSDHYGGMEPIVREFKPRYFVATGSSHTTKSYLKLLEAVKSEGITAVEPTSRPRKVELGTVEITILPQPPEDVKEENDNSIGLRLQYGGFSMLLTGDSEDDERRWWLAHCPDLVGDCSILKLAHHGSRIGTDAYWLELVAPDLAVASLGKGNSFGHPHSETLALLRQYRVPLLRTDERGTITLVSDGETWNFVTSTPLARRRSPRDAAAVAASRDDGAGRRPSRSSSRTR
jgi:beta-lactamase superfamily II metal-dependent hydrolase